MRGRRPVLRKRGRDQRTTPAGAGTTCERGQADVGVADHPRGCGDDTARDTAIEADKGPPPRVRGRPGGGGSRQTRSGTTPAGAGTTTTWSARTTAEGDHPRGCGDDPSPCRPSVLRAGSPPRVRGRHHVPGRQAQRGRTTPAGAGTTLRRPRQGPLRPDHPRGCGDDVSKTRGSDVGVGPPPRVRGRHRAGHRHRGGQGTTPAGAGTTGRGRQPSDAFRDHPRGCGDDACATSPVSSVSGPPPRVRGRPDPESGTVVRTRTTPAGAGTTPWPLRACVANTDHPRGCGDDGARGDTRGTQRGPPPRVRGRRTGGRDGVGRRRTTPAGAGTTLRDLR